MSDAATPGPIGAPVDATPAPMPQRVTLHGRLVTLEALDVAVHGDSLYDATRGHDRLWLYMPYGPFAGRAAFDADLGQKMRSDDPLFFAIVDRASRRALGHAAYMRIVPAHRVIEVGSILFAPELQRTAGATEAMYLMAKHVFEDLGYRRYEWKCDALNAPSRAAALRLGFTYEGIFRQHMIIKSRNRDTAWFSIVDAEWPARKAAFERWLDPANFDARGVQKAALRD